MQCMKCGRDIEAGRVFCDECLQDMEKYPVKPGTVVQIPYRPAQSPAKKTGKTSRHPALSLEEQVRKLKKRVIALSTALVLAVSALAGVGYLWVRDFLEEEDIQLLPGQNYSSSTSTRPGETE